MKHIKFTYVDAGTKVSVAKKPAFNGPVFPIIKGLQYLFALERKYPTHLPEFVGTCDDDADLTVDGFMKELDRAELEYERQEETNAQKQRVRVDRDFRIAATDWTQLPDSPVDKQTWATYRQALRDVPQQEGFPWDVQWPELPRPEQPYPSWVWENDQWNPPVPHPDETGEKLYDWDEQTLTWIEVRLVRFGEE